MQISPLELRRHRKDIPADHKNENLITFLRIIIRMYKIECPSQFLVFLGHHITCQHKNNKLLLSLLFICHVTVSLPRFGNKITMNLFKEHHGASEKAQWVKLFATNYDDLCLFPQDSPGRKELSVTSCLLSNLHIHDSFHKRINE